MNEISLPELCGGLNTREAEYSIADNQSPDMLNLWYKNKTLSKRPGQELVTSLANVYRISSLYNSYKAVHAGTNLYKWNGTTATKITTSALEDQVAGTGGVFVEHGDKLYYMDGTEIWVISSSYAVSRIVPYVPTVKINTAPDNTSGDDSEAYNLLGAGFKVTYNGNDGGDIHYYAATVPDVDTFTVTATFGSTTPMDITSDGTSGWKVRETGGAWITGTPAAEADTDVITLAGHGLSAGDELEFDAGTGALPGGISAYNSDAQTVYQLPQTGLDATEIIVKVGGVTKTLTSDYTWVANTGVVTFAAAPADGTNNVEITAYKTVSGAKAKIANCTIALPFGGEASSVEGGSRVFVMGNASYPTYYWRSDLGLNQSYGMTYFPDTSEELLDMNAEPIKAAAKMAGELIIFKTDSTFALKYQYDGTTAYYPTREISSSIGCDVPKSVQLIDNRLVFCNSKTGIHIISSTNNQLENTIKPISANINKLLLAEGTLTAAVSADYDNYYWLCVNGNTYLWDYDSTPYYNYSDYDKAQRRLAWYRFNNIYPTDFYQDTDLYYAKSTGIVKFIDAKNDFGAAYEAYFKSKAFDLGAPNELKTFVDCYPSFSTDGNVKATVTVGNEDTDDYKNETYEVKSFSWNDFNWAGFAWDIIKYAKTYRMRLKMKKKRYIQIKVENDDADRGIGLSSLQITYFPIRKIKR